MRVTSRLPRGIQRQGDGSYRCEVRIRPLPKASRRFPAGTSTAEMLDWLHATRLALRQELKRELAPAREEPEDAKPMPKTGALPAATLADDVKRYLTSYLTDVHPSTRANRKRYLQAWVSVFGKRRRQSLTTQEIQAALNEFRRHGIIKGAPLAPETVNQVRLALLRVYECLNADEDINPVKRVPLAKVPKPEARGVTYDIVEAILAQLPAGTPTAARCRLMAYTGMRPCEIMRIRPAEDWDRTNETLLVRTAKGGLAARIHLLPQATQALDELARLNAWGDYWAAPVSRAFMLAKEAAGYASLDLVPYDLRHCFGTLIYAQTGDLKAVKETLRHSTLRLSERYMAAAVSPMLEQVHDKMTEYFAQRRKSQSKRRSPLTAVKR